jgi:transcriptional antiterminator RfaH
MWYVANTAPGTESKVCRFLALQGTESYVPEFRHPRGTRPGSVRDGRHRWVFPGYVFFRPPANFSAWHGVYWVPGIRQVLRNGSEPAVMDDVVLEELRERLATAQPRHPGAGFQPGQLVRVEAGALAMIDAVFDRCLDAPDRVRILVQLLGRQIPVDVNPTILSAAS